MIDFNKILLPLGCIWLVGGLFPFVVSCWSLSQSPDIFFQGNQTEDCGGKLIVGSTAMIILFFARSYILIYAYFSKKIAQKIEAYYEESKDNKVYSPFFEKIFYLPFHFEKIPWYSKATNMMIRIIVILLLGGVCSLLAMIPFYLLASSCLLDLKYRTLLYFTGLYDIGVIALTMGILLIITMAELTFGIHGV